MPVNRNALIRYNTIDKCLQNRLRKWTLDDLVEACSDALYEFEGIDKGVSKRTVQMDIQMMRSEKLGYNAPIVVLDKKYYTYEDDNYSITNIPLTDQDLNKLTEVVDILRQFKGFTHFKELTSMIQKLEDKIHTSKTHEHSIIDLEKNENLRGLDFIDPIYQAILNKKCIEVEYQSFKNRNKNLMLFHPFLLKEHRNRWFVLGSNDKFNANMLLALDRMQSLKTIDKPLMDFDRDYIANFFNDVIGVTVNEGKAPQEVILKTTKENAPYIITKPMHHSQKIIGEDGDGVLLSLQVQHNFELERDILAFGDRIKVVAPPRLRAIIKKRIANTLDQYNTELNQQAIKLYNDRLDATGSIIVNGVFTAHSLNIMCKVLQQYKSKSFNGGKDEVFAIRRLFKKIPDLKELCFSANFKSILEQFGSGFFLTKAIYFDKPPKSNWYVTWHQDLPINVTEKKPLKGYKAWTQKDDVISVIPPDDILHNIVTMRIHLDDTNADNGALKVVKGSHKKVHKSEDIHLMTGAPITCNVNRGGLHIMKPLLLHASSKTINQKRRRVLHLEFSNKELPNGIGWAEREKVFK